METHEKIKWLRLQRDWSQDEMAHQLNMSASGYGAIERGETNTSYAKLQKIARVFNMDVSELESIDKKNIIHLENNNATLTNCPSTNNIYLSPVELKYEVEKLNLIIKSKDQEIEYLKEIIALMKKS